MKIFLLVIGILILIFAVIFFDAFAFALHAANVIYKEFFD